MHQACKACPNCGDHCTVIGPSPVPNQTKSGTMIWSDFQCSASQRRNSRGQCVDRTVFEAVRLYSPVGRLIVQVWPRESREGGCADIPPIVQVSFSTGIFAAAGKCRLQKEGTCIGNQISPVLSGLPVVMAEQTFFKSLPHAFFPRSCSCDMWTTA